MGPQAAAGLQVIINVNAVPRAWATRYNIWVLIELTPKGVAFSFLFLSCMLCYMLTTHEFWLI